MMPLLLFCSISTYPGPIPFVFIPLNFVYQSPVSLCCEKRRGVRSCLSCQTDFNFSIFLNREGGVAPALSDLEWNSVLAADFLAYRRTV